MDARLKLGPGSSKATITWAPTSPQPRVEVIRVPPPPSRWKKSEVVDLEPALPSVALPELPSEDGEVVPAQYAKTAPPKVPTGIIVFRVAAWLFAGLRFMVRLTLKRLSGTLDEKATAAGLRQVIESMGPTAIKTARRIAMRLDLLPLAYAAELSKIRDTAPAIPIADAIARVERATKRKLEELFETFDPTPIVSDSLACVYQAVLRDTNKRVAVRVRRPQAQASFAAERIAIGWLVRYVAPMLGVRHSVATQIGRELPRLLFDDLDFVAAARTQQIFRREARRAKLDWLTAADVYLDLSSADVTVSEFVSGVWLDEVIAAEESQDPEMLARLEEMNIDPALCGKRLLNACWWGFFEGLFFCEVPAASQIVVRKNGQLVFIALGDTGILGKRQKKLLQAAFVRFALYDVEGAVAMLVQLLMPLPFIDVHEFTHKITTRLWSQLFAMQNPQALPWERTSTSLWLALFATTREYGVQVSLDLSRMMQSMCLYDTMAARLWPEMRVFKEFQRYQVRAIRRAPRLERKILEKTRGKKRRQTSPLFALRTALATVPDALEQANLWAQTLIDNAPVKQLSMANKSAYSLVQAMLALTQVARVGIVAWFLRGAWVYRTTGKLDVSGTLEWVLSHPVLLVVVLAISATAARRIMFRLADVEEGANQS